MTLPLRPIGCMVALFSCLVSATSWAQSPPGPDAPTVMPSVTTAPPGAEASARFNPEAATEAYLAQIPAGAKTRSDAYFEGGYWLLLWGFLYGAAVSLLLLHLRWSAAMRRLAERITRRKPIQTV